MLKSVACAGSIQCTALSMAMYLGAAYAHVTTTAVSSYKQTLFPLDVYTLRVLLLLSPFIGGYHVKAWPENVYSAEK